MEVLCFDVFPTLITPLSLKIGEFRGTACQAFRPLDLARLKDSDVHDDISDSQTTTQLQSDPNPNNDLDITHSASWQ